jgi:hypothetical protein
MPNPYRDRILEAFWPARMSRWSKLCAVLDCARDERIFSAVERSHLSKSCLYAGRIPWVLQRAAPHLIVLEPGDRFTSFLLDEGWGDSWGIYLRTELPMMDVRHHLRTLLRVQDESGRKLIFRWYDPRVLRAYLPTCLAGELRSFFGPVEGFYCEGAEASTLLDFRVDEEQLVAGQLDLAAETRNPAAKLDLGRITK